MKIINFKKKRIKLLTKVQQESYDNAKICCVCQEKFEYKYLEDKKYCKVRDHCHYIVEHTGAAKSICNLEYRAPKKLPIVFNNRSNYDYHFIIKELAEEFKKQFTCLGENTEKYVTFTVLIEGELIKMENKLQKIYLAYYNLLIVQDFLPSLLSNLVNNLSEGIHRIKCKKTTIIIISFYCCKKLFPLLIYG